MNCSRWWLSPTWWPWYAASFDESLDKQQRLESLHTFYVDAEGKRLLVQDPTSGNAISLQKWRSKGDKVRVA